MTPNMRQARFGLKKTALSLTDGNNCRKCKLRKEGQTPLFTVEPVKRKKASESILVVLTDYPLGRSTSMSNDELRVYNNAIRGLSVDRVHVIPVVKCAHNKAPTKLMVECCEYTLRKELETIEPNVIVCLGKGPATIFNLGGKLDEMKNGVFDVTGLKTCTPKLVVTYPLEKVVADISLQSELTSAFRKAERFCTKTEVKPPDNYKLVESPAEFKEWVDKLVKHKDKFIVAFDIETNGRYMLAPEAKMRCIGFSWASGYALCVPFERDPDGYLPIIKGLFSNDIRFIAHNAVYDVGFLKAVYAVDIANLHADTMLMAYTLDPTKGKYGYGLKGLSIEYTDLGAYETDVKDLEDAVVS